MRNRKIIYMVGLILLIQASFLCQINKEISYIEFTKAELIINNFKNYPSCKQEISSDYNIINSEGLYRSKKHQHYIDTLKNNLLEINKLIKAVQESYNDALKYEEWKVFYPQAILAFESAMDTLNQLNAYSNINFNYSVLGYVICNKLF